MESFARRTARFIFGSVLPRRAYPVMSGPLKGARFVLGALSGEGGGASAYFDRMESEQTERFVKELEAGQTFFDVGANVGYYSILASRLVGPAGKVVAFEPVTRNIAYLQRHIELNDAANVRLLPFAVSSSNGLLSFSTGPNSAMGSIDESGDVLVAAVTLDDIAERLNLRPDVVKMDVEGAEMDVFRGAGKVFAARPKLFLSTHSPELRDECLAFLASLGYTVEPLVDGDDPHEFFAYP